MVDVPVRHNVNTNTPLPTCACVFTHAHISSLRLTCDPAVAQLSQFWKDRFRGRMTKGSTMTVIVAFPALFYLRGRPRTQGIKILKYWIKGKECCQTLYLSCLKNCLMDRSLFVCLTASLNVLWIRYFEFWMFSLIISHSLFCRKEVSLSFRFRRLTSEAWGVSNECNEFQSASVIKLGPPKNILCASGCECRLF